MNILFPIASFYPSQQGGPCNSVYQLARGLVEHGINVKVVTSAMDVKYNRNIILNQWMDIDGISVYYRYLPTNSPRFYDFLLFNCPLFFTRMLSGLNFDLMHLTGVFTILSHIGASIAQQKQKPYIWSPRGELMPIALQNKSLKKNLFLGMKGVRERIAGSSGLHAASESEYDSICKFQRENLWLQGIPVLTAGNIIGEETFQTTEGNRIYDFKYILYMGRIARIKNIETLLQGLCRF